MTIARNLTAGLLFSLVLQSVSAQSYTADAPIVNGDVSRARNAALREVMNQISMDSEIELRASTALINERFSSATLLTSHTRITGVSVEKELVNDSTIQLTLKVQRQAIKTDRCKPPVFARNTRLLLNWLPSKDGAARNANHLIQLVGQKMESVMNALIADRQADSAAYDVSVSSRKQEGANTYDIVVGVSGINGALIKELHYAFDPKEITAIQKEDMGGATLIRHVPSRGAENLSAVIAQQTFGYFECLPVVLRVPDGAISNAYLPAELKVLGSGPISLLYADRFPIKNNGTVDLLGINGLLPIVRVDQAGILLEIEDEKNGHPASVPAQFVIVQ